MKNLKLDQLILYRQKLDKIYTNLLNKTVLIPNLRNVVQSTQRSIISPQVWRKKKANVQTLAGRSFVALRNAFSRKLYEVLNLLKEEEIEEKEFRSRIKDIYKSFYQRAYNFGLKAGGLGMSLNYLSFSRLSKLPALTYQDRSFLENSIYDSDIFISYFLKTKDKEIPEHFFDLLSNQYDVGRLVGAPARSVVYWKRPAGSSCELCGYMENASPWPTERLLILPFNCKNCSSTIRIIPKNSSEYDNHMERLSDTEAIENYIRPLLQADNY